ncbi:MFS transporter [Thioalkalivibrio sp. HK1]|uniref:MFS transporter n=1 Tax=Thioalkalivibrio sp. HK1 TaxID=1469245 RepID=UPI0018CC764D|nr:MFS transporter [Thioalkalivibrio sp. HK1]
MARFKIDVALLATCQALFMTSTSLLISISAIAGLMIAPREGLATIPLGIQFLSTMLFTFPASLYMQRAGRRAGFIVGAIAALAGGLLGTWSMFEQSFVGLCAATFFIGMFTACANYYRFAAADVADETYRSRAISLVMAGGIVAAFAGPNLAIHSKDALGAVFAGGYLTVAVLALLTILILLFVHFPPPPAKAIGKENRPLAEIALQPRYMTAVLCAVIGYAVMNLLMTSTPLAMERLEYPFSNTAHVIQWHVVGMFLPSFFTGHLIRRFGVLSIMLVGAVFQALCVVVNLNGESYLHFLAALVLLGVGWNFLFIGATTLLAENYRASEKAKAQGLNDLLVFSVVAMTATSAGYLLIEYGWQSVNSGVLPFIALAAAVIVWTHRSTKNAPASGPSKSEKERSEKEASSSG